MTTMRAVGSHRPLPVSDPDSFVDLDVPVPTPAPRDLIVEVKAVSVNPVDTKERQRSGPYEQARVLGYDAAGVVVAVGSDVTLFAPGDEVWYAGSIRRQGSNSQFQAVDERIVGRKPTSLGWAEAAAMPLTAMTAWEGLFDSMAITPESKGTLLVLGAAGGAGSMAVQLGKVRTGLTVIGTASRPESREFVLGLGADHVVDHADSLTDQVLPIAPEGVNYVFSGYTKGREADLPSIMATRGHLVMIDSGYDTLTLRQKSISVHWEWMFTRSYFGASDMIVQHEVLMELADLVDAGKFRTTLTKVLSGLSAATLREAHGLVETGRSVGKVVVEY